MQFFKERIPALLHKSRRTLALSKAPECDVILFFILHGTTLSHARHDTSVCASAPGAETGEKCEASLVCPMEWVPGQPRFWGMKITHLLCPLRPFRCLFAVSAISVLSMTSVSLYPLYSLDLLPLEGEKMTFNNLRETNESHYLEFFWDSRYIWWFLLLHHICWFYSYSSYLMVFQSHQRGRDWKMKVIFGSRTLFHVLGLINKVTSRSQFISTQLSILFNKAKDSRGKRFSMVTSASG